MRTVRIALLIVLLMAVLAVVGGLAKLYDSFISPGPHDAPVTVIIPSGTGFSAIVAQLHEANVIAEPWSMRLAALYFDNARQFKAGEYIFPAHLSPQEVMQYLVEGKVVLHKLTVPEGLTVKQVAALVAAEPLLTGTWPEDIAEGTLLPETYHIERDATREALAKRMQQDMQTVLDTLWRERAEDIAVDSKEEALILASIVEKETAIKAERGMVAAVFSNRLKKGMKLQADPTVIYAVELRDGKPLGRPLWRKDLEQDLPHNTYFHTGLPPTPICNPGPAALQAVLNPDTTDALYFVADGKGGHVFANTLVEHNRNVREYRKWLRENQLLTP